MRAGRATCVASRCRNFVDLSWSADYAMKKLLFLLWVALPLPARACHCLEPHIADAYARSTVVAMIRIERVKPADNGQLAEGEVLSAWKSNLPAVASVVSLPGCDYPLAKGEFYLLFLERTQSGDLTTGRCRGNRLRAEASVSLFWLNRFGRAATIKYDKDNPSTPWSVRIPAGE
jgi:hypothetical protein